jgi:hypothetical protein
VEVAAGNVGTFMLTLALAGPSDTVTCQAVVSVVAPSCAINGPDHLEEGSAQVSYIPSGTYTAAAYAWSIAGNGTIATVAPNGTAVVNAGDPGSFELRLEVTQTSGPPVVCTKTVIVDPLTCSIQGPASVPEFSTNILYTTGPTLLEMPPTPGRSRATAACRERRTSRVSSSTPEPRANSI